MDNLELISHDLCPFVQRAEIALREKDVPFTRTTVDLEKRPAWFNDISPRGKVPLLRVGGEVIFESAVILEYLEETQSPALHPRDPLSRARHRGWIEYGSALLMDNYAFALAPDARGMRSQRDTIREKVERLEQVLGDGPYFGGESFSLVDAAFAPFFRYWSAFELIGRFGVLDRTPRAQTWMRALAQRPSVRATFTAEFDQRLLSAMTRRGGHLATLLREPVTVI